MSDNRDRWDFFEQQVEISFSGEAQAWIFVDPIALQCPGLQSLSGFIEREVVFEVCPVRAEEKWMIPACVGDAQ